MPFPNRIRLPLTLFSPQFIDEQEKFRKSNGTIVVLSNVVRKQYDVRTDYIPEKWHERLKIAIAHDYVNIESEKYLGGITQEGGYEIAWPDFLNYPFAPATFKVEVNGFNARNSNCGTCAEYAQVVTEDDDIGTIGEDETAIVPILYNDAICCSPFEISIVTFNSMYLDAADVIGNTLQIHTKTGIPTQNSVILATYRVTCENGMYDEANVVANVEGSIVECLSPINLTLIATTGNAANVQWRTPSPAPDCDFVWNLYLSSDLGTPVQSGTKNANLFPPYFNTQSLNSLLPNTSYVFQVASDCCEGDLSPFVSLPFTTQPPEETEICGTYEFSLQDTCGLETHRVTIQYLDCNDTYQQVVVFTFAPQQRCLKQYSNGDPVYWEVIGTTMPPECEVNVNITYIGPC